MKFAAVPGAYREVDLPGGLVEELSEWKARTEAAGQGDPVFVSRNGKRQQVTNVDHRLKGAIERANEALAETDIEPISERVSPHSLRRTYASLRAALRDDPVYIAEQLGHTDPAFTFRVYQKAAKRRERLSGAYLNAFDSALDWARMGEAPRQDTGRVWPPTATNGDAALLIEADRANPRERI